MKKAKTYEIFDNFFKLDMRVKKIFGLSNNTIIKYRQTGVLPYTTLGDIFLYDSAKIEEILRENNI